MCKWKDIDKECSILLSVSDAADSLLQLLNSFGKQSQQNMNETLCTISNEYDETLLMKAAKLGRFECCKVLLSLSPKCNLIENKDGLVALNFASYHGHLTVVLLLTENIPNHRIDEYVESAIESAVAGGQSDLAKQITALFHSDTGNTRRNKRRKGSNNVIIDEMLDGDSSDRLKIKSEASLLFLKISAVHGMDSNQSLVGSTFPCLKVLPNNSRPPSVRDNDVLIGRGSANDIVLSDLSLSKSHAVISFFENKSDNTYLYILTKNILSSQMQTT